MRQEKCGALEWQSSEAEISLDERVGDYNLDATKQEQWEADMAFYMQESLFYFRGGVYGSIDVFCKVWREGDSKTYQK
jgi:hypothetical protein